MNRITDYLEGFPDDQRELARRRDHTNALIMEEALSRGMGLEVRDVELEGITDRVITFPALVVETPRGWMMVVQLEPASS